MEQPAAEAMSKAHREDGSVTRTAAVHIQHEPHTYGSVAPTAKRGSNSQWMLQAAITSLTLLSCVLLLGARSAGQRGSSELALHVAGYSLSQDVPSPFDLARSCGLLYPFLSAPGDVACSFCHKPCKCRILTFEHTQGNTMMHGVRWNKLALQLEVQRSWHLTRKTHFLVPKHNGRKTRGGR